MKGRIVVGALLVSAVLASQGFGFELLDNLLGMNRGRTSACCEPQACDPACAPQACDPACAPKNCCDPVCQPNCCDPCCKPRCDLFAGLKGLFACKKCCDPCGTACCEDVKCCTPEPNCCDPQACDPGCDPGCNTGCKSICIPKCTPVRDLLEDILSLRIRIVKAPKCCNSCCETACCEPNCCEEVGCNGGGVVAPSRQTPKVAPAEKPAPLPDAPTVDPSASLRPNRYYKASRSIVRN